MAVNKLLYWREIGIWSALASYPRASMGLASPCVRYVFEAW